MQIYNNKINTNYQKYVENINEKKEFSHVIYLDLLIYINLNL